MAFGQNQIEIVIKARDEFSRTLKNVSGSIGKLKDSAVGFGIIGAAIGGGIGLAVKSSIDLETAMVGVRKTTGLTAEETDKLRREFVDLSKVMPVSSQDLASIGEVAGQLGIQGTEDIRGFTETVAKMSIATELTAEDAALSLAKISNAMGTPISEAETLASIINELSNISAASSSEIVSSMSRVAGSAKTLGLSTDVVAGMTAALINAGEPAERAGTKLRSAFDTVVKKIDDVEKFMPGFSDALRTDANGAILSLIDNLNKIEDPITRQQTAIDLFGTVGASAVNKLSNDIPGMNKLLEAAAGQTENATSIQEEYDIAAESTANQLVLLANQFKALGEEIGRVLVPIIRDFLLPVFRKIADFLDVIPGPVKTAAIIFGTVFAGALLLVAGAIFAVTMVSLPWLLIIAVIAAAITAVILIIIYWKEILLTLVKWTLWAAKKLDAAWQWVKDGVVFAFTVMKNVIFSIWNAIVSHIESSVNAIIDAVNVVVGSKLFQAGSKMLGLDIGVVPNLDLSGVKGQLTDLPGLVSSMQLERDARASQFGAVANQTFINIEGSLLRESELIDIVNEGQSDKLGDMINTP